MLVRLSAVTALAVLLATGPGMAQQSGAASEQTAREAGNIAAQQFVRAYNGGDPAQVAALFAPGGVYLTPAGTMLSDPEAVAIAIGGRMKAGWTKEQATQLDARPVGDSVWTIGEYALTGTGQNSGKQIGGFYAAVLERAGAGWKFRVLAANLKTPQDVTGMQAGQAQQAR
jgi:ketosteroid isomerase-like protein